MVITLALRFNLLVSRVGVGLPRAVAEGTTSSSGLRKGGDHDEAEEDSEEEGGQSSKSHLTTWYEP